MPVHLDRLEDNASVVLRSAALFRALAPRWIGELAAIAVARSYPRGTIVFRQGEACPGIFVVVAGSVRVFKSSAQGKDHVLHLAGPRTTFAEVAVLGGFPCPATAEAVEDTTCLLLPSRDVAALLAAHHELCLQLLSGMAAWVRHLASLLEDVVLRDAGGRLARYLLDRAGPSGAAGFTLPMLKKDLASHLNLTSETLSRTLRRFVDAGLLAVDGQRVQVLDGPGLRALADGA